jgi:hypothetical protein
MAPGQSRRRRHPKDRAHLFEKVVNPKPRSITENLFPGPALPNLPGGLRRLDAWPLLHSFLLVFPGYGHSAAPKERPERRRAEDSHILPVSETQATAEHPRTCAILPTQQKRWCGRAADAHHGGLAFHTGNTLTGAHAGRGAERQDLLVPVRLVC